MVGATLATPSCGDKKADPQAQAQPETAILSGQIAPAGSITTVTATDASGKTTTAIPTSTGAYSFPSLVVGSYTLAFTPATGYVAPAAATVTLVAGGTTASTTTVAALVVTATLSGQVLPAGAALKVTATDASGKTSTATPTSTGAYAFQALPVGAYTLAFTPIPSYVVPPATTVTLVAAGTTAAAVTLVAARPSATFSVNGAPITVAYIFGIANAYTRHLRFSADPNGYYGPTAFVDFDWVTPILGTFTLDKLGYRGSYTGRDFISYETGVYYAGSPYFGTVTITYIDPVLRRFSGTFNYVGGNPTISSPSGTLPVGTPASVSIAGTFDNQSY